MLLALDLPGEAGEILSACLELDPGHNTYRRFVEHALSAERPEDARALVQRALAELEGLDRDSFQRWWERSDPEAK